MNGDLTNFAKEIDVFEVSPTNVPSASEFFAFADYPIPLNVAIYGLRESTQRFCNEQK